MVRLLPAFAFKLAASGLERQSFMFQNVRLALSSYIKYTSYFVVREQNVPFEASKRLSFVAQTWQ